MQAENARLNREVWALTNKVQRLEEIINKSKIEMDYGPEIQKIIRHKMTRIKVYTDLTMTKIMWNKLDGWYFTYMDQLNFDFFQPNKQAIEFIYPDLHNLFTDVHSLEVDCKEIIIRYNEEKSTEFITGQLEDSNSGLVLAGFDGLVLHLEES